METDKISKALIIIVILEVLYFGCIFAYVIILSGNTTHSKNQACESLGFDKFQNKGPFEFCKDSSGNLHYVEFYDCNFWGNNCQAIKITVGEVEVAPK